MKTLIFTTLIYFVLTSATFAGEVNLYVAPSGNDQNPGTRDLPVATFSAARDLVRKYKSVHEFPANGITIWVSGGTYYQREPFVLNETDSGKPGIPVVWRAIEGEKVSITGGISIATENFHKISDKLISKSLTHNAAQNVQCCELKTLGITNYGAIQRVGHGIPVYAAPMELFFNHEPMTLARYPNEGFIPIGEVIDGGSIPRNADYSGRGAIFKYTDKRHAAWVDNDDVWFQGTFDNGYADDQIHVEKIDTVRKQVKLSSPHMYGVRSGQAYHHYVALNILEELDRPGEYYLDRKTGFLYFWPPSDLQKGTVIISIIEEPLVCLEGVSHIVFRDFTIEFGRGIGLYMERGQNNLIAGCNILNLGTSGICMGQGARQTFPAVTVDDYDGVPVSRIIGSYSTQMYKYTTWDRLAGINHRIQSCDIFNTGSGGIILSGGNKRQLIAGNNAVENCKIHNYNRRNKFRWAGVSVDGCGNKVSHCEIFQSDFHGIFSVGPEHLFEYNNIHHVTLNSDDVSAWYTGRDPSDRGLIIRYNYFHDCGNPSHMTMGVYCDDSTAGVTVFGNVFFNMHNSYGVLYSNSGRDLTMRNNIVINPQDFTVELSPHYFTWYKGKAPLVFGKGKVFDQRLLKDINIKEPPYSERYPELANYMDVIVEGEEWEGMWTKRNILSTNVIIGGNKDLIRIRQNGTGIFEKINNFQTANDPGFVDFKGENFMLRQDSEVFKILPDFKPVPFDKMGLYADEFRKAIN